MKTYKAIVVTFILTTLVLPLFSQVSVIPQGFNYQAIARDTLGSPKANQSVTIRFTITNQTETSTPYIETHVKTTDEFGLFMAVIGQGTQSGGTGTFSQIDWKSYSYYTKIEIQEGMNWYLISKEQLLTVPYAMISRETVQPSPAGSVIAYFGTTAPVGWLMCDGSAVSRTTYANLYAVIGTSCGNGDGSTTFNLPDLRGRFLRGMDGAAGNDPDNATRTAINPGGNTGNNVGSLQDIAIQSHTHHIIGYDAGSTYSSCGEVFLTNLDPYTPGTGDVLGEFTQPDITSTGSYETRPKNVYVNYIIKY